MLSHQFRSLSHLFMLIVSAALVEVACGQPDAISILKSGEAADAIPSQEGAAASQQEPSQGPSCGLAVCPEDFGNPDTCSEGATRIEVVSSEEYAAPVYFVCPGCDGAPLDDQGNRILDGCTLDPDVNTQCSLPMISTDGQVHCSRCSSRITGDIWDVCVPVNDNPDQMESGR